MPNTYWPVEKQLEDIHERVLSALKALIAETERCDNPRDFGVGSTAPVMVEAQAAVAEAEKQLKPSLRE